MDEIIKMIKLNSKKNLFEIKDEMIFKDERLEVFIACSGMGAP